MKTIVFSELDPAGVNIAQHLIENFGFNEAENLKISFYSLKRWKNGKNQLLQLPTSLLEADYLNINTEFIIFASKHSSQSQKPALTVHTTGNWGEAKMGGNTRELAFSSASLIKSLFLALNSHTLDAFEITLEATHHGPTNLKIPLAFAEIGSSPAEWKNERAGEILAETIMSALRKPLTLKEAQIGFGGPHYAPKFTTKEKEEFAFSHICPKYLLDELDENMIRQTIDKTVEKVSALVIDWKGSRGGQREKVKNIADMLNINLVRV